MLCGYVSRRASIEHRHRLEKVWRRWGAQRAELKASPRRTKRSSINGAQCLASAAELVQQSHWEGSHDSPSISYVAVLPVVVVPDERLWIVEYDSNGDLTAGPVQTEQCSLFVNRAHEMQIGGPSLRISHVEFVTLSGLRNFVADSVKNRAAMETIFPPGPIATEEQNLREGH